MEYTCDINEFATLAAMNRGDCSCERHHNNYDGQESIFTELRLKPLEGK